ncbi:MAG: hypothetical protein RIF33_05695 [Cyclobacteriaceae bacterium]
MKQVAVVLILLAACQPKTSESTSITKLVDETSQVATEPFQLMIDSTYILNSYEGERIDLESPEYSTIDNESIYSYIKTQGVYQIIDSIDINREVKAKIVYTNYEHLNLDD